MTKKKKNKYDIDLKNYDIKYVSYISELPKKYYLYIANLDTSESKHDESIEKTIDHFEKKINRKIDGKIFIRGNQICIFDQQFISERENPLFEEEEINE